MEFILPQINYHLILLLNDSKRNLNSNFLPAKITQEKKDVLCGHGWDRRRRRLFVGGCCCLVQKRSKQLITDGWSIHSDISSNYLV
jgi:hypothetical protein